MATRRGMIWWVLAVMLLHGLALRAQPQGKTGERIVFEVTRANVSQFIPGRLAIRFSDEFQLDSGAANGGQPGSAALHAVFEKFGITGMQPLFASSFQNAEAGENSAALSAMRQWGLHRWFGLKFSSSVFLPDLIAALKCLPEISKAEPACTLVAHWQPNDTRFGVQWNLLNTGQSGGIPGADIKMTEAWDIEKGRPEVLVSVHDGGIQIDHPDLQQNIWFGKGFNFVTNSPDLVPDAHGTHVAGILGGVSNNGIGIAGVAGGDGTTGTGARLMSLQIIGGSSNEAGYEANSFVFAANNGAAISQNSWSYSATEFFPSYTADAIDYFIENGGGNQLKGGLVVFSAGNNNSEQRYFPAPYSRVLAVAATGPSDEKGPYSSYGDWVDITAPGGNLQGPGGQQGGILSTFNNGDYGILQGTSMAAPHVSGVAALVVSHLPGRMLADDVRSLLLRSTDNIYPLNEDYLAGKLGAGRLNALKTLSQADILLKQPVIPPPTQLKLSPLCERLEISWVNNTPNTSVMLASSTTPFIGLPNGQVYQAGDTIIGGGVVIYKGTNPKTEISLPLDGSIIYFRVWVVDAAGTNYSTGTNLQYAVPYTVDKPRHSAGFNNILVQWNRQCPGRGVLLVYSTNGVFGKPSGDPAALDVIQDGGIKLAHGNLTSFDHTNLEADRPYYYAMYPYMQVGSEWQYASPVILSASTACTFVSGDVVESFSGESFPPEGWRIFDGGPKGSTQPDNRTWQRSTLTGSRPADQASALINAYTQNGGGSVEVLRSPAIVFPAESDSLIVSFDYAYRAYSPSPALADSLELAWTTDCGASFNSLWKRGGAALATVNEISTTEFVPDLEDWKTMRFALSGEIPKGSQVNFLFRATNKFGQNLWLDNIFISAPGSRVADASVEALLAPSAPYFCEGLVVPAVRLANRGRVPLDSVQVAMSLNGAAPITQKFALRSLEPGRDTALNLGSLSLPPGANTLRFWSQWPNGQDDDNPSNDTLSTTVKVTGATTDPLKEAFDAQDILPANWINLPPASYRGWVVDSKASLSGRNALVVSNEDLLTFGTISDLVSPTIQLKTGIDSLFLSFDVAAAFEQSFDGPVTDSIEVLLTTDCGANFTRLALLEGNDLAAQSELVAGEFVPNSAAQWLHVKLDMTPYLGLLNSQAQLVWRNRSRGVHNVYLDNIQCYSKTVPESLKKAGFGVYPNPFDQYLTVWHLEPPNLLRGAVLVNTLGQQVARWQWLASTAPQTLRIDTRSLAAGWYTLVLHYQDYKQNVQLLKIGSR